MELRALAFALVALGCSEHPPLEVAKVELERFQGGWYEIAKFPRPTQEGCVATTAYYRLTSPTELDVYSECREGDFDGLVRRMAARAVADDPEEPAKLSLDFGGFFGDYWVVEVEAEYRYAAVGHPSRDYLWILARTPVMSESDFDDLVERVRKQDFDVTRLEMTRQAGDGAVPVPTPSSLPSPSEHGCAFRRGDSKGMRAWPGTIALAVLLAWRRYRSALRIRHARVDEA